jgi:polar amino acid transport system substrate-binding protein
VRLRATVAMTVTALLVLAGCGSPGARPVRPEVTAAVPLPLNVQDPAEVPSAAAPPNCVPRATLRPAAVLPQPGRMPAGSAMAEIAERGRLVIGIDQNAYLFSYRDPGTGDLVGFEIDIARAIAQALLGDPKKIEFKAITTADRIPVLQRNEADLVIRTMTMTCDRWQQISFSSEYISSHQRLLVRKGSGIRSFADLARRKVCATRGSTSIVKIAAQPSRPIPVSTDSTLDCLVMLQQGQVDAVSTVDILLAGLAAQDPTAEVIGDPVSDEPSGVGVARDEPELVRFVNGVLERIRADGTWQRSYNRWLAGRLGPATPPPPVYRD